MVLITKAEAEAIRERLPHTHIVRTMKKKSNRHRYYCTESREVRWLLNEIRGIENPEPRRRRRSNNRGRNNRRTEHVAE